MSSPTHCLWAYLRFAKGVGATVTTEAFPTEGNGRAVTHSTASLCLHCLGSRRLDSDRMSCWEHALSSSRVSLLL